jgi:hypothetical protein
MSKQKTLTLKWQRDDKWQTYGYVLPNGETAIIENNPGFGGWMCFAANHKHGPYPTHKACVTATEALIQENKYPYGIP